MTDPLAEYRAEVSRASVVSFDVFDTLIHRLVFRPRDVFAVMGLKLRESELTHLYPNLPACFSSLRIRSEQLAREQFHARFGSHEISLQEIYDVLGREANLDPDFLSKLIEEEIALETFLVYPNPLMQRLFEFARQEKKRVILCSDMYLSAAVIEKLLMTAGYQPPFELFVSGEIRKSKHEGSIFPYLEDQGIDCGDLVHFGDNRHADFVMPKKMRIKAHHWSHVSDRIEPNFRFKPSNSNQLSVPTSLMHAVIQREMLNRDFSHDFWFDIGFQIFGPLFLGKFLWFVEGLRNSRPDKVLFFARDAHIHHRLFVRYGEQLGVLSDCDYAYFSRASLLLPSLTEYRLDRSWFLYSGKSARSVGEHLRRLGVEPATVTAELQKAGYRSTDDPVTNGCPQMFGLLNSIYPHLLRSAAESREDILKYMTQLLGDAKKIAIVDIGWVGNMQASFSRLLQLLRNDFDITGYYYGTFHQVSCNYQPRNTFNTYLVHECRPSGWYEALLSGGVELLEFAQMAPHGTTLGYQSFGNTVEPILEKSHHDETMQGLSFRLQEGAESFIEAIMPMVMTVGAPHLVSTDWAEPFFRLVTNPTREEAEYLGEVTHSDAPTGTNVRIKLAPDLSVDAKRYSKNIYLDALEQCYWKAAFKLRNPEPRGW